MGKYFYEFLEEVSEEMAKTLAELEKAIYNSPRSMLTHSRTFIEFILEKVMIHENMPNEPYLTIIERIQDLDNVGILIPKVRNSFHEVRKLGNQASHDTRQFRFSESLTAWENIYTIVKWYIKNYVSDDIKIPEYVDPIMKQENIYELEEMVLRFEKIEELLKKSLENEQPNKSKQLAVNNQAEKIEIENKQNYTKESTNLDVDEEPGFISVRTITYGDDSIDIPYFLRDAFLLPQRFEESERFLIRLGGEQQARIMSELPNSLEGFHKRVTRYNESHSKTFFNELKDFVAEEIRRKKLMKNRPGELFLFYKSDEIVVTEDFGNIDINKANFQGMPSLIDQLNQDGIYKVRQLPKELLILGKYKGVGKGRVKSFFEQLKAIQKNKIGDVIRV